MTIGTSQLELRPMNTTTTDDDDNNNDLPRNNNNNNEDEDDNVTIIFLEAAQNTIDGNNNNIPNWIERIDNDIIFDDRRRIILLNELKRIQRTSFIHFIILCIIPLLLFVLMIIIVLGQNETCTSYITQCILEPRTFVNAFTTRCICDPIPVERNTTTLY